MNHGKIQTGSKIYFVFFIIYFYYYYYYYFFVLFCFVLFSKEEVPCGHWHVLLCLYTGQLQQPQRIKNITQSPSHHCVAYFPFYFIFFSMAAASCAVTAKYSSLLPKIFDLPLYMQWLNKTHTLRVMVFWKYDSWCTVSKFVLWLYQFWR